MHGLIRKIAEPRQISTFLSTVTGASLLAVALLPSARAESYGSPQTQAPQYQGSLDHTPSRSPAAQDDAVTRKLKSAVAESELKLGALEPWQKKIFDEEAITQYSRFIRDYRSAQPHSGTAASNLVVDIDLESLKNYLKFYAPKSLLREEKDAVALIYLRSGSNCAKCEAASPALRKLVASRIQSRGFRPVWLAPEDLGAAGTGGELQGKALESKVADLGVKQNASAALVLEWAPAPADDEDSAHAGEERYLMRSHLEVRGLGGPKLVEKLGKASQFRKDGQFEILANDSFEVAGSRLLSDAFTELGVQMAKVESLGASRGGPEGSEDPEVLVAFSGIGDFAILTKIKALLQARLPEASVEERKVTRGRVVFAISGGAGSETIKAQLAGLKVDGDEPVKMEIQP